MTVDDFLSEAGDVVLVEVARTLGSTPREAGAFMLVGAATSWGTIGGGNMEFDAIDRARAMLAGQASGVELDVTLGPDSGQCCGGRVWLAFTMADDLALARLRMTIAEQHRDDRDVYVFGSGHVGRALAVALKPLPFKVTVVETRADELALLDRDVARRLEAIPEAAVADIRPGGAAVILTHDHNLDFLIAAEALKRDDLGYVGMIGSKSKRGVFLNHLDREGAGRALAERLILPVGGSALRDKRPEVIAALVAAELLVRLLGPQAD